LWGKLQILGIGTAIKILLTNENDLMIKKNTDIWETAVNPAASSSFLNRQEVIALLNTLNQFSKSVEFSARAEAIKREGKGEREGEGEEEKQKPTGNWFFQRKSEEEERQESTTKEEEGVNHSSSSTVGLLFLFVFLLLFPFQSFFLYRLLSSYR
jgi:hypothetical protein